MTNAPRRISPGALAVLALFGLALLGFGFLFAPGLTPYSNHSDAVTYSLGAKESLYRAWSTLHVLPFWQSHQMSGGPALTNPQGLYFYPLHFLFFVLPPSAALGPTFFLHFLVAGLVFYALGRTLGLESRAALFMGAAGMFNSKLLLAAYAGWLPLLPGLVLSPLLAMWLIRIARRPTLGAALGFAITTAMCLCSGHIQVLYYTSVGCAVFLALRGVAWVRAGERAQLTRVFGFVALGSVLALGLAAYLLVPTLAELPLLSRSQASYDFFVSGHATTLKQLATLLSPEALGTPLDDSYPGAELWEDEAYFGLVPLLLALFGVLASKRREVVRPLGVAFVVTLVLAMNTPILHALWLVVPGLKLFHCPSRLLFVTSFIGITLAGFGFEALATRIANARLRTLTALLLLGVVVGEGTFYAHQYLLMRPASQVLPHAEYAELLHRDASLFRVAPLGRDTINAGWAAQLSLELITGYDPYNFSYYGTYFDLVTHGVAGPPAARAWFDFDKLARPDLLDALNVGYLVTPVPIQFPDQRYVPLAALPNQPVFTFYEGLHREQLYVYRASHPLGRAFFVDEVLGVSSAPAALAALQSRPIDKLAIAELAPQGLQRFASAATDAASATRARAGQLSITTHTQARRFVVISEVWHPGWRATLDGKPVALARTDYALLGAFVPAGTHKVELTFEPLHWQLARNLSLFSLAVLLVLLGWLPWTRLEQ